MLFIKGKAKGVWGKLPFEEKNIEVFPYFSDESTWSYYMTRYSIIVIQFFTN